MSWPSPIRAAGRAAARLVDFLFLSHWRKIDAEYLTPAASPPAAADAPSGQARPAGKPDGTGKKKGKRATPAPGGLPVARALLASRPYEWTVLIILVTVAVSLAMQEYYGERTYFYQWFPREAGDDYWHLKAYVWWSGWRFLGYVALPMLTIALLPGERIRDYFVSPKGFFKHLWIYVALFLLILPAVWGASRTEAFYRTYPFYKLANRSSFDFWAWQGLYWLQFLSLEFFFRGFMLHGLGRVMGHRAIFVMIVPYCMIHFGKPFSETIGAIGAGIILGTLAMRTRSIWGGVVIHVGVAFTMDFLALGHCPSFEDTGRSCVGK